MYVYVDDVDALFSKALSAGAKVLDPVKDQFWGDRHGGLEDRFGYLWSIATHEKDLFRRGNEERCRSCFLSNVKVNFHLPIFLLECFGIWG